MILAILIFMLAAVGLCFVGYKSNMIYPICVKLLGQILILFSALAFVIKMSMYNATINVEQILYIKLFNIKLNIPDIAFLNALGMVLYIVASLVLIQILSHKKTIHMLAAYIPPAALLITKIPRVEEHIYIYFLQMGAETVDRISALRIIFECMIVAIYIILPYRHIYKKYKQTVLYGQKKDSLSCVTVWGVVDVTMIIMMLGSGMYRYTFFNLDWFGFPMRVSRLSGEEMMFIAAFASVMIIVFIIMRYNPMKRRHDHLQTLINEKDENIFTLLHTYKNAFCAVMMYAGVNDDDDEDGGGGYDNVYADSAKLEIIGNIAKEEYEKINSAMMMFKSGSSPIKHIVNLAKCTESAIKKSRINDDVDVVCKSEECYVLADEYKLTECMVCLLNNSNEAVKNNTSEKRIVVKVGKEHELCFVEVRDNGCGIAKEDVNKIFKPFYSTKKRADNYGLGLAYVKRVVQAYGGDITVKSKKNKFTVMQIVFKQSKKEE